jgi:DNA-binding transcriptional ArsR family regulator
MAAPTVKRLEDPRTMRALAHPLRLRLLGLLRIEGPGTATTLAGRIGASVPGVSYHLRQLAEHGFIEHAPELARNAKERWWRASHERTSWRDADFLEGPERIAAEGALTQQVRLVHLEHLERWHDEQASWGREWVDAADMSDVVIPLNPVQLRAMRDELHEVLERWRDAEPGPGSEHVFVILNAFPTRVGAG